jgi:hypothetical protein
VTSICGGGVVLGLGKEVGHDGEEESERGGEEQADAGVEDGADVGQAAEEVEVEEERDRMNMITEVATMGASFLWSV